MPIYEYECGKCHRTFELVQSFNASRKTKCQYCDGKAHRLISPTAIVFKGSGFHVTDYSRSSKPLPKPAAEKTKSAEKPKTKNETGNTTPPAKSDSGSKSAKAKDTS